MSVLKRLVDRFNSFEARLVRIEKKIDFIKTELEIEGEFVMQEWETLKAKVAAETTMDASVVTLLQGVTARLNQLASQPTINPADVAAVSAEIDANTQGLAAAAANVPVPAA